MSTGAAAPAAPAAREAISILHGLGYRALSGRAFDALGHALGSAEPAAAKAAFEQAVDAFDSCGAVWRRDRVREALAATSPDPRSGPTVLPRRGFQGFGDHAEQE